MRAKGKGIVWSSSDKGGNLLEDTFESVVECKGQTPEKLQPASFSWGSEIASWSVHGSVRQFHTTPAWVAAMWSN